MIETKQSKDKKKVYMYCSTEKRESDVEVHGGHEETGTTLYECLGDEQKQWAFTDRTCTFRLNVGEQDYDAGSWMLRRESKARIRTSGAPTLCYREDRRSSS